MPDRVGPIYVDIDGTLTTDLYSAFGVTFDDRIARLREMIAGGFEVVVWSWRGSGYARNFAEQHGLECLAIGKPAIVVQHEQALPAEPERMRPEWLDREDVT